MIQSTGLRSFITGNPRRQDAPKPGSKTQKRRIALRSYTPEERKHGRNHPK